MNWIGYMVVALGCATWTTLVFCLGYAFGMDAAIRRADYRG